MPRLVGQVDQRKSVAILDAAAEVLAERGLSAPMEEIARRAGVSKQTLYNRYGSKTELARALAARRVEELVEPLESHATGPRVALETFARALLHGAERKCGYLRMLIQAAGDMPDLTREVYDAGPRTTARRLARYLAEEDEAGRLAIDDPQEAAEMFMGMVVGHWQLRDLLGADALATAEQRDRRAAAAADAFVRAHAPLKRRAARRIAA